MAKKSRERIEEEMETGDKEEDIYTEEGAEVAEDDDSITNEEEGFMKGYNESETQSNSTKKRLKSKNRY